MEELRYKTTDAYLDVLDVAADSIAARLAGTVLIHRWLRQLCTLHRCWGGVKNKRLLAIAHSMTRMRLIWRAPTWQIRRPNV